MDETEEDKFRIWAKAALNPAIEGLWDFMASRGFFMGRYEVPLGEINRYAFYATEGNPRRFTTEEFRVDEALTEAQWVEFIAVHYNSVGDNEGYEKIIEGIIIGKKEK